MLSPFSSFFFWPGLFGYIYCCCNLFYILKAVSFWSGDDWRSSHANMALNALWKTVVWLVILGYGSVMSAWEMTYLK